MRSFHTKAELNCLETPLRQRKRRILCNLSDCISTDAFLLQEIGIPKCRKLSISFQLFVIQIHVEQPEGGLIGNQQFHTIKECPLKVALCVRSISTIVGKKEVSNTRKIDRDCETKYSSKLPHSIKYNSDVSLHIFHSRRVVQYSIPSCPLTCSWKQC